MDQVMEPLHTQDLRAVDKPWLRRFTKFTAAMTLFLIFMGGLVKSHEAGLSVPDWPTSYGHNMFSFPPSMWQGGVFYEHTHRLVASFVGFLILLLVIWIAQVERRVWVKVAAAFALLAVVAQGVLGGLTVLYMLPAPISVAHGVLAQSFLILTVFLAYSQSKERQQRVSANEAPARAVGRWAVVLTAVIWVQLVLGAFMRHTESGLAIPDFPTTAGQWIPSFNAATLQWVNEWRLNHAFETGAHLPDVTMGQVLIHFAHRAWALVAAIGVAILLVQARRTSQLSPAVRRSVYGIVALTVVQVSLGVLTVWTAKGPMITSFHVFTGAGLLALSALCAFQALPLTLKEKSTATQSARSSVVDATPAGARG